MRHGGWSILGRGPTAAFWDAQGQIIAVEGWDSLLENGASLIAIETIADFQQALSAFQEDCELDDDQLLVVTSLFNRKIARPSGRVYLSEFEMSILRSSSYDLAAIAKARDALLALHIYFPEEAK